MKKLITVLSVSAIALMGVEAQAQTMSADVGNPDSANMLVIEEGYEVIAPAMPANQPNEVPAPAQIQPATDTQPAQLQPQAVGGAVVMDSVTTSSTPDSESEDIEEEGMSY